MSGFWKIGTRGLGNSSVSGRSLVPSPAPRTNACLIAAMALEIQHGRGNSLARKRFAMEELRVLSFPSSGRSAIVIIFSFLQRRPSPEIRNFSPYILLLLVVPIFIAAKRYLQTKCTVYELTTERLKTTKGIFSKVTDTLEFYRVKDIETQQPFL